jgi:hypothetical protein
MVFKALNDLAPAYIQELLFKRPDSSRSLRSDNQDLLVVPRSHSARYGDRNFRYAGPLLWNKLPIDIRKCKTVDDFKKKLKTLLFNAYYN